MTVKQTATVRSHDEIADAIRRLSPGQWGRLRATATVYARGRPIEAEDLLQEAFRRALGGHRKCPNHVDVVKFLAEAMRSIAHGEKEKQVGRPLLVPLASHGDISDGSVDPPAPGPTPAEHLEGLQIAATIKAAIIAIFDDDLAAQFIVEGVMEGLEGEELRKLTELDATAFQSKRKLIRRRIAKHFPEGWRP